MSVQPDDLGFRVFLRERKAPHVGGLPNVFFLSSFSWRLADGFSMSTKIIGSKNRLRRMREMQIFAKQPTSPILRRTQAGNLFTNYSPTLRLSLTCL